MRWLIGLLVLGLIYYLLAVRPQAPPSPQVSAEPTPVPTQPAPAPPSAAPAAPTPAPTPFDLERRLYDAARRAGVELVQWAPEPGGCVVWLRWASAVPAQGGAFLDECLREGLMRSFEEIGSLEAAMIDGRPVYQIRFRLRF